MKIVKMRASQVLCLQVHAPVPPRAIVKRKEEQERGNNFLFTLDSPPPSISPAANRLLLGLSSFHITGNLHFLRVFFFFPSFFLFFLSGPPSTCAELMQ